MSHTKGEWRKSGLYVISQQNEEDYIRICQNLSSDADASLIAAAPIGQRLAEAILVQEEYGINRSEYILKTAKEFIAKTKKKE